MTREQLEHAIRAACDIAQDDAVFVFGSQAILGQFPDAPAALRMSIEVDMCPRTRVDRVDDIDGAIGELSTFRHSQGFYVHGLTMEGVALPSGWASRTVEVKDPVLTLGKSGLCLEAHDLAASKLAAFRDKDRDFVRVLIQEELIKPDLLKRRIRQLPLPADEQERRTTWVQVVTKDLAG